MIPKLNLVSALAALVFFFLPWVRIECRGERMATQTGVQMILGSATATERTDKDAVKVSREGDSLGHSYWAGFALVAVIGALLMALAALIVGRRDLDHGCGILCVVALACLLLQLSVGFPAERAIREELAKPPAQAAAAGDPLGGLGQALAGEVARAVRVAPAPGFYWELGALALPALILGNAFLDRIKAKDS